METTRIKLAALWIVVMFSIVMADIISFIHPRALERIMNGSVGFTLISELLLVFSILTAVPIVMIFLSLVLHITPLRWVSTLVVVLTTLFVVGGGSATLSYFFFATLEIVSMIAVLWFAWREFGKTELVRTQFPRLGKMSYELVMIPRVRYKL